MSNKVWFPYSFYLQVSSNQLIMHRLQTIRKVKHKKIKWKELFAKIDLKSIFKDIGYLVNKFLINSVAPKFQLGFSLASIFTPMISEITNETEKGMFISVCTVSLMRAIEKRIIRIWLYNFQIYHTYMPFACINVVLHWKCIGVFCGLLNFIF